MLNAAIKKLLNGKENGSPETLIVQMSQLRNLMLLGGLFIAASSIITFALTGQKQVDALRGDFSAACIRHDKKDMEQDAALNLIEQRLGQIDQNVQRLLDIQLKERR